MRSKYKVFLLALLAFVLLLCCLPVFAEQSFSITETQVASLSKNLSVLKDLTLNLRLKLDSYGRKLQITEQELKQSEARLELAEKESNIFILKLNNQQTMLAEQSKSLKNAKKYSRQLRRKDKMKDLLLGIILLGVASNFK